MGRVTHLQEPLRQRVSTAEWAVRVNLAACYRLVALFGMTDLIYNHITARTPGLEHHFLINPYGMLYEEITASSLMKVDLAGKVLDHGDQPEGANYSVNAAGYIIHSAVHAARKDVDCVIHTHTRAGVAIACMEEGLLPLTQHAMRLQGHLSYHEYEGPAFNRGEKGRLVANLGTNNAMILRNHGLLACGASIAQAFNMIYWLETACRIQVDMLACGRPLHLPATDVVARTAEALSGTEITLSNEAETNPALKAGAQDNRSGYGQLEWPALLRKLDRLDNSFRD